MKEHLNTKMVWNVNLLVTGISMLSLVDIIQDFPLHNGLQYSKAIERNKIVKS